MSENRRKAAIALGVCLIALMFGVESAIAHHHVPSPLSWLVWTLLGTVGAVAAVAAAVYRRRARAESPPAGPGTGARGRRDP
jgi:peptidoglycan/LPS O-acetylase OafA/YrhL